MGFGAVRRQISTTLSGRSLGFRGPGGRGKSHLTGPVGRVGDWRPRIDREVEGLIIRMAEENRSWGYDRIVGALTNLGHEVSDQAVGNVLRRHGMPPALERKRRTTWAEFIRIHLALLAGTDISAAEVLMRGSVTCYVLFFIYFESSRIDTSRITQCPNKPLLLAVTRDLRIRGCGTRQRCYALQDRD